MIRLQCVSVTRYVTKFLNATVTRDDYHYANERFASNFTSRAEFTGKFVQFDLTGERTQQSVCTGDVLIIPYKWKSLIKRWLTTVVESFYNLCFFFFSYWYILYHYSSILWYVPVWSFSFVLYYIFVRTTFTSDFDLRPLALISVVSISWKSYPRIRREKTTLGLSREPNLFTRGIVNVYRCICVWNI